MEKRKYSKFIIKNGNSIETYNVSYDPIELYRFTLGVKKDYRFEKDFSFVTKKGEGDINIPYEADVDKVLLYSVEQEGDKTRVEGLGIMKSEFEKIIGMSGNLKGQEVFFDDVCDKFRRLDDYIEGSEDEISQDKKVDLVNQYLNIFTFDYACKYDTSFEEKMKLLSDYLGDDFRDGMFDVVEVYEYVNNLAKDNRNALTSLEEKGIKVLQKTK